MRMPYSLPKHNKYTRNYTSGRHEGKVHAIMMRELDETPKFKPEKVLSLREILSGTRAVLLNLTIEPVKKIHEK